MWTPISKIKVTDMESGKEYKLIGWQMEFTPGDYVLARDGIIRVNVGTRWTHPIPVFRLLDAIDRPEVETKADIQALTAEVVRDHNVTLEDVHSRNPWLRGGA